MKKTHRIFLIVIILFIIMLLPFILFYNTPFGIQYNNTGFGKTVAVNKRASTWSTRDGNFWFVVDKKGDDECLGAIFSNGETINGYYVFGYEQVLFYAENWDEVLSDDDKAITVPNAPICVGYCDYGKNKVTIELDTGFKSIAFSKKTVVLYRQTE